MRTVVAVACLQSFFLVLKRSDRVGAVTRVASVSSRSMPMFVLETAMASMTTKFVVRLVVGLVMMRFVTAARADAGSTRFLFMEVVVVFKPSRQGFFEISPTNSTAESSSGRFLGSFEDLVRMFGSITKGGAQSSCGRDLRSFDDVVRWLGSTSNGAAQGSSWRLAGRSLGEVNFSLGDVVTALGDVWDYASLDMLDVPLAKEIGGALFDAGVQNLTG